MLSHIDAQGNPMMVNVSEKQVSQRTATARSIISLPPDVLAHLIDGDLQTKKGPVFQTAIIAGIMAAKKTGELIPLCHPLGLDNCTIDIGLNKQNEVVIDCTASITAKTGVEMEALAAVSAACLTIYDMMKFAGQDMTISRIQLVHKSGGKSGVYNRGRIL